ncbi:MAG: ABC transporter ATP-binding protein [Lachnospiraceae bacterium]|nr:ABC transporter ATP-binding protein [Lachnospiraceae bacterium]
MSTIVECNNLSHSYGKSLALDDISLRIESGKIVGLFGPNGSGKTTLIKMLTGMIHDETGAVTICGNPVGEKSKAVVSYSPDRVAYRPDSKITGLLDMYELMYDDFDRNNAEDSLKELGIGTEEYVGKLSKGSAEKLQIILTMSRKAKFYILDEPINGVDPVSKENIIKIMLGNVPDKSSIMISTHQIEEIEQVLDEAIFIKEGKIVFHKSVDELREETGKSLLDAYKEEFR